MAVVKNGRLSGAIGPVVATSWKGQECVRSRPVRRDFTESTERQEANRKSFKAVNNLAQYVKTLLINPIWNISEKGNMSGYNRFIKENKKAYNGEGKLIDPRMLKLTVGNLPFPLNIKMNCHRQDKLVAEISWENPTGIDEWHNSDQFCCILFAKGKPRQLIETEFTRNDQQAILELPDLQGEEFCLFVFFRNVEGSRFSDSLGLVRDIQI